VGLYAEPKAGDELARQLRFGRVNLRSLVHHRVDGVLELEDLALDVYRDLLRQVPARHGFGHVGDIAHLTGQVARHRVHTLRQVLPRPGHALHVGLAAELALGPDLTRHTPNLLGKWYELFDLSVDGVLELEDLAL